MVISLGMKCLLRCRLDTSAIDLPPKLFQGLSMGSRVLMNLLKRLLKTGSCHNSWMSLLALHEVSCFQASWHHLHVVVWLPGHYTSIWTHYRMPLIIIWSFVHAWLLHKLYLKFLSPYASFPVAFSFFAYFCPDFLLPHIKPVIIINICNRWALNSLYFKSYRFYQ